MTDETHAAIEMLAVQLNDPERRLAAIEALGASRSADAVDRLQPLANNSDKAVRKAARVALHRLKSAGVVAQPIEAAPAPPVSPLLGAVMSNFDAAGSHIVQLFVRGTFGARRALMLGVDSRVGIRLVGRYDVTKPVETAIADLVAGRDPDDESRSVWVEIPADYAAHLLRVAMQRNTAAGHSVPAEFAEVARFLPENDPYAEPLIYRQVRPIEVKLDPSLLEGSGALVDEREFKNLGFGTPVGLKYGAEIERVARTPMLVAGVSRDSQLIAIAQRAHHEIFDHATRQAFRYILEETAAIFWLTGRHVAAKRAVAAAVALGESDRSETPFSARLVSREIFGAAGSARTASTPPSSGLWTP
ncbi:MAG: HEAT repeat domain-containing protein [Dehalococcoidia bacterium]